VYIYKKNNKLKRTRNDDEVNTTNTRNLGQSPTWVRPAP